MELVLKLQRISYFMSTFCKYSVCEFTFKCVVLLINDHFLHLILSSKETKPMFYLIDS